MVGKQKNPVYSEEFKLDAVRLVTSSGRSVAEVARELGISGETLRLWVKAVREESGESSAAGGAVLSRDERDELRELRKRVKQQDEIISVLKKATAFFANDPR